jgi:hypothetical protein
VPCLIVPAVALFVALSATCGGNIVAAIMLVVLQLACYVIAYRRLVHGRWNAPWRVKASTFHFDDAGMAEKRS